MRLLAGIQLLLIQCEKYFEAAKPILCGEFLPFESAVTHSAYQTLVCPSWSLKVAGHFFHRRRLGNPFAQNYIGKNIDISIIF